MKTSTKRRKIIRNAILGLLLITLICIFSGYNYYSSLKLPVDVNDSKDIIINIPSGASTSKIANILKKNDLIRNELYFRYISKQRKIGAKYQAGDYKLHKSMDTDQIIEKLINGEVYVETAKFTIPEGFELNQIVERLSNHSELNINKEKLLNILENEDFDFKFLKGIPKGKNRLEGYLFPDTYEVTKDSSEKDVILIMLNRFDKVFKEEYYERANELNMSIQDIITLASIIEREARVENERPIISGVFYNRLEKEMLLQSCATIQYVLGERKEKLTYKDLEIESSYNTYKNVGLPPAPIASPGESSIKAALYPDDTKYLYFVAKGDGSHVFTKTYKEHLKAKNGNN
ncbi:endolytic transglycosylase MltG [Wukongibacter baidiensis]|uniref:endolytic transglycosylase MltG n=1 Tax=Wukongibacter baidiensis TaxID=1723361 RepID=UPI003D7FBBC3